MDHPTLATFLLSRCQDAPGRKSVLEQRVIDNSLSTTPVEGDA